MITVHDSEINNETLVFNLNRLKNQIFHLLPLNEEGGDWLKPLDTIILEIAGLSNLFPDNSKMFELLTKLEGLKAQGADIDFK
jgi:hypothetical protein